MFFHEEITFMNSWMKSCSLKSTAWYDCAFYMKEWPYWEAWAQNNFPSVFSRMLSWRLWIVQRTFSGRIKEIGNTASGTALVMTNLYTGTVDLHLSTRVKITSRGGGVGLVPLQVILESLWSSNYLHELTWYSGLFFKSHPSCVPSVCFTLVGSMFSLFRFMSHKSFASKLGMLQVPAHRMDNLLKGKIIVVCNRSTCQCIIIDFVVLFTIHLQRYRTTTQ